MKGSEEVAQALNDRLSEELAAVHQYILFSEKLKLVGLHRLAEAFEQEIQEELGHATRLTNRLLFLGYVPEVQRTAPFDIAITPQEMIQLSYEAELDAIKNYNETISICLQNSDVGTALVLQEILKDEEHHVQEMESALYLIQLLGTVDYLATLTGEEDDE